MGRFTSIVQCDLQQGDEVCLLGMHLRKPIFSASAASTVTTAIATTAAIATAVAHAFVAPSRSLCLDVRPRNVC